MPRGHCLEAEVPSPSDLLENCFGTSRHALEDCNCGLFLVLDAIIAFYGLSTKLLHILTVTSPIPRACLPDCNSVMEAAVAEVQVVHMGTNTGAPLKCKCGQFADAEDTLAFSIACAVLF